MSFSCGCLFSFLKELTIKFSAGRAFLKFGSIQLLKLSRILFLSHPQNQCPTKTRETLTTTRILGIVELSTLLTSAKFSEPIGLRVQVRFIRAKHRPRLCCADEDASRISVVARASRTPMVRCSLGCERNSVLKKCNK